jgi:hypothetical protein
VGQFECGSRAGWKTDGFGRIFDNGADFGEGQQLKRKSIKFEVTVSKRRDQRAIEYLVKHLNQAADGQRAAKARRKKAVKK